MASRISNFFPVVRIPWRRVGLHGYMECPECGAIVYDWKGRNRHTDWHSRIAGVDLSETPQSLTAGEDQEESSPNE